MTTDGLYLYGDLSIRQTVVQSISSEPVKTTFTQGDDFGAVLDYYAVPDTYMNTLLNGAANNVPILTGNY